jgi:septal ring-binding cell division protein DamX
MLHALLAIRDLPSKQRDAWQTMFNHYVFQQNGDPVAPEPESPAPPSTLVPEPATAAPAPAPTPAPVQLPPATALATAFKGSLFDQRLAAGKKLAGQKNVVASIQLFYSEDNQPTGIEGFLKRADGLGKLQEIYLVPARFGDREGLRILYGTYPSVDAARNAIKDLPTRYQESFATAIHVF